MWVGGCWRATGKVEVVKSRCKDVQWEKKKGRSRQQK